MLNSSIDGVDLCYSDAGEVGAKEQQGDITKMKVQHAVDVTKLKNNQRNNKHSNLGQRTLKQHSIHVSKHCKND